MKIAVAVPKFSEISETFVLKQIVSLIKEGEEVTIVAFNKVESGLSHNYVSKYNLFDLAEYISIPKKRFQRGVKFFRIIVRYFFKIIPKLFVCLKASKFNLHGFVNAVFKLEPFLKTQYDVLYCHFGPMGNEFCFIKKLFPKMKFLVHFHGYDMRLVQQEGEEIYDDLFDSVTALIAPSEYAIGLLNSFKKPYTGKIYKYLNSVDIDSFISEKRIKNNTPVILTVARLVEEKDFFFALSLMKILREDGFNFKYIIIGGGYLHDEILNKIQELNLSENVDLLGSLSEREIVRHMGQSNIFLLTSKMETFGTVLLEAQATGVPVVARNVGGISEAFIDNKTGFLFSRDDKVTAISKLKLLLTNPDLCEEMGRNARVFIEENFDFDKINHEFHGVYTKI